jgi:hypothetical protein
MNGLLNMHQKFVNQTKLHNFSGHEGLDRDQQSREKHGNRKNASEEGVVPIICSGSGRSARCRTGSSGQLVAARARSRRTGRRSSVAVVGEQGAAPR